MTSTKINMSITWESSYIVWTFSYCWGQARLWIPWMLVCYLIYVLWCNPFVLIFDYPVNCNGISRGDMSSYRYIYFLCQTLYNCIHIYLRGLYVCLVLKQPDIIAKRLLFTRVFVKSIERCHLIVFHSLQYISLIMKYYEHKLIIITNKLILLHGNHHNNSTIVRYYRHTWLSHCFKAHNLPVINNRSIIFVTGVCIMLEEPHQIQPCLARQGNILLKSHSIQ